MVDVERGANGRELHISSLVIHARPADIQTVHDAISRLGGTEIHAVTADGRMVVTLETATEAAINDCMAEIGRLAGVLSMALVFHQVEKPQT